MLKVEKFVKEEMIKKVEYFIGCDIIPCDLGLLLFEEENITGSFTCNSYESIQWIKDYFEELDEIVEEYELNLGDSVPNPFAEPERFQLIIILYISDYLANRIAFSELEETTEITKEVASKIIEELRAL